MAAVKIWLVGLALAGAASGVASAQVEPAKAPDATQPAAAPKAPPPKPAPAASKPAAPAKPGAKGTTVEAVTVTGAAPDVQTTLDRKSYTLGKDLQATTGSIADALRNLPSVEVDLQGNLSLRGDPSVTILVDGKPAPAFEGAGRADALQQLPADQIERVEVITNPSAALNPEGSGGIINLITKQSRGAGATGSAYGTVGSAGLKRAGANFGYNSKKLAVTGSISGNYQRNKSHNTDLRGGVSSLTGLPQTSLDEGLGRNLTVGPSGRLNLTYTATPKDQLTASGSFSQTLVHGHPFDRYTDETAEGELISILARQGARRFIENDDSLTAGWRHTFAGDNHVLSVDLIHNDALPRDDTTFFTVEAVPPIPTPLEAIQEHADQHHSELRAAYSQNVAGGPLKTGYELKYDDNHYDYSDALGADLGSLAPVAALENHFAVRQTINAVYATYEHAFGDLSAQAGLRIEDVHLDLDQLTSGQRDQQDYTKAYPTLHLAYKLDDQRKLTASYSVRVQRPPAFLLNPLPIADGPKDIQQGNPNLKPQDTNSFEVGYELHKGPANYTATAYYRKNVGEFTPVLIDLGDGVFESTFGNLGSSRAMGMELTAGGKLSPKLSYTASFNGYWKEISATNLGIATEQSGWTLGGRANLNWQVRPDDLLQLNAIETGQRLVAQGLLEPYFTLNLGWRHKVNDRITATVTAQDALGTNVFRRRLESPTVFERLDVYPVSRAIFFRLDYRFGGGASKPAKEPDFEYETGGPG